MPQSPLVSICLPVFNGNRYLAQAIDAALAQTYRNIELIIRDDNSTDDSQVIAQAYSQQDARVRYRGNVQRLGLFQNYNECIKAAKGTYIKLYAQDDLLDPQAVEKMVEILESDPKVALVTCSKRWIDEQNTELDRLKMFKQNEKLPSRWVIMANLICLNNWIGEPSTTLFRAKDVGLGFDANFYHWGDIDYWFRLLQKGDLCVLTDVLCSFRRHAESTTSSNLHGLYFIADIVKMWHLWRSYLEDLGETETHFFQRATEKNALHVDHLVRHEELKAADVRLADPKHQKAFSFETMADFREALFYCQQRVTTLLEELIKTQNELEHRSGECRELRAALRQMEKSVSWRITKPLRLIRARK